MSRSAAVVLLVLSLVGSTPSRGEPAGAADLLTLGPGEPDRLVRVAAACPTFHWGSIGGPATAAMSAGGFELVVAEVVASDEGVATDEVLRRRLPTVARLWTPHLGDCLERGALYAWRLRPLDAAGVAGAWTPARYFEVAREPSVAEVEAALSALRQIVERRPGSGEEVAAGPPLAATAVDGDGGPAAASPAPAPDGARKRATSPVDAAADRVAMRGRGGSAGRTIGVVGDSASEVDGSIGVVGESTATAGATIGVAGQTASAAGTAGVFDNLAGGKLLSGRVAGVELFVVSGAGEVAATSFSGDGSALSGVDAALLDGLEATAFMPADADDWIDESGDTMTGDLVMSGADIELGNGDGALRRGGDLFLHGRGVANTALGLQALAATTVGEGNTAIGALALTAATTGSDNTAVGHDALELNLIGSNNTAVGRAALRQNLASGNSAFGTSALQGNVDGFDNTAVGNVALSNNTDGSSNVAVGGVTLFSNTSGSANTAVGSDALQANGTGHNNTALGEDALRANGTGSNNTALGAEALRGASGSNNLAVGYRAGFALDGGTGNIMIANVGLADDTGTIRIGDGAQSRTFVAGIRDVTTGLNDAIQVVVDSNGQLGTVSSSLRGKRQVASIGGSSERLHALRPVSFRYLAHDDGPPQFGLIAEEVAEVMPELVVFDAAGRPATVRYQALDALLLNELQRMARRLEALEGRRCAVPGE